MAIGILDSAIFADMFGTPAMRGIFGDDAFLARCAEVEAALARAQERLGIIPLGAGEAIAQTAKGVSSTQRDLSRSNTPVRRAAATKSRDRTCADSSSLFHRRRE